MNPTHTWRHQSEVRTSGSHPLRIDEVVAGDAGGRIGITFCPGKCGPSGSGYVWQRDLAADLDVVTTWKPDAVVTLIENHEFAMLGVAGLGDQVEQRGIKWHHLPIVDVRPPDARFEACWEICGPRLAEHFAEEAGCWSTAAVVSVAPERSRLACLSNSAYRRKTRWRRCGLHGREPSKPPNN
jgi:hypothetical protein